MKSQIDKATLSLDKARLKVTQLQESLDAILSGEITPQSIKNLQKELDNIDKSYIKLRDRARELESQKTTIEEQNTYPISEQRKITNLAQLRGIEQELASIESESEALYVKSERIRNSLESMKLNPYLIPEVQKLHSQIGHEATNIEIQKDKLDSLTQKYKESGKEAKKAFNKSSKGAKKTANHTKRANGEMSKLWNRLKGLAASALVFNAISKGLTSVREKLNKMLKADKEYSSSLSEIYGNLLTAFQPIYEYVLPALNSFLSKMKVVTSYMASFTSAVFGKTVKESEAAAKALHKQTDATEELSSAMGSYDELEVIGQEKAANDIITPTFNVTDYSGDSYFQSIVKAIEDGDVSGVVTSLTNKLNSVIANIDMGAFAKGANELAKNIANAINSFTGTFNFNGLGTNIAEGLNAITDFIFTYFTTVNWGQLGNSIGSFIAGSFKTINFRKISNTITETLNSVTRMITGLFAAIDWTIVGSSIADFILGSVENFDAVALADNITTVIKSVILLVAGFLETMDFKEFSSILTDIVYTVITEINWVELIASLGILIFNLIGAAVDILGSMSYDTILQVLQRIFEGLGVEGATAFFEGLREKFSTGGKLLKQFLQNFIVTPIKEFLGIHSPSTLFKTLGNYCIEGFLNGLQTLVGNNSVVSGFKNAWSCIKAIFSESRGYFREVWSGIQAAFGNPADWFKTKFTSAWSAVKSVFSKGGSIFVDIKNGVLESLKKIINGLIDGINKVMKKPFEGLNDALSTLKSFKIGTLQPFKNIATISVPQIPKLAKGDVIPPNKEFLAILGDQKHGTNIETPLDTMVEAFNKALDSRDDGGDIIVKIGERELGRASRRQNKERKKRYGTPKYA